MPNFASTIRQVWLNELTLFKLFRKLWSGSFICYRFYLLFQHCGYIRNHRRIHWRLSTILKTSIKSVWSNDFQYIKVYIMICLSIFFSAKRMNSMTLKHHNSFQNKNNRKTTHTVLLPNLNKKLQQEVWKFRDEFESAWVGAPQKLAWRQTF